MDDEGNICGFIDIPIRYHCKCYQNYTSTRNVSFRLFKEDEPSTDLSAKESSVRTSNIAFDKTKCVFCDCGKKKGDASLVNVCSPEVQQTIYDVASQVNDYNLSTKVLNQDLIALEAKYHTNCLSAYKRRADRAEKQTDSGPKPVDPYAEAFKELLQVIEEDIRMGKAFEMTALCVQFETFLQKFSTASYRGETLKKCLINYFRDKLTFHKPTGANQSELVYSNEVDIRTTLNKIAEMKRKIKDKEIEEDLFTDLSESDHLTIVNAAVLIRSAVRNVHGIATNSNDKNDITEEKAKEMIPETLFRFAASLLGEIKHMILSMTVTIWIKIWKGETFPCVRTSSIQFRRQE